MNEEKTLSGPEIYQALQLMAAELITQGAPPSDIAWAMLLQGVYAAAQMDIPEEEVRKLLDQALRHAYPDQPPNPSED